METSKRSHSQYLPKVGVKDIVRTDTMEEGGLASWTGFHRDVVF
jgi:hypothetical protein